MGRGVPLPTEVKWLILVQIPLYILTEMLGIYCQDHDSYCILLAADGILLLGKVLGRDGPVSPPENFGTFSLEMAQFGANSVVYFNRNVTLFTARYNSYM